MRKGARPSVACMLRSVPYASNRSATDAVTVSGDRWKEQPAFKQQEQTPGTAGQHQQHDADRP